MPEFIMKSDCNITQNQRHYFFNGATKCGEEYANNKDYNNALAYYNESGILFKKLNYEIGTAYNIGNRNALCRNW
jgi:hypothetical protein